jgi:hypothetical protein
MTFRERKEAAATNDVLCKCFIAGTPLQKSLWGRIKDVFFPDPQQFTATISAVESKDPEFKWVTIVEAINGCTISVMMDLRKLPSKHPLFS